jgi:hypothetical protein
MATLAVTNDFSAGAAIVASEMNTNFSDVETFVNSTPGVLQLTGGTVTGAVTLSNTLTVGQDDTGYDVKLFGATSGTYLLWDESEDNLLLIGGSLGVGTTAPGVLTTISKDLSADTTLLAIDNQNNEYYNTNLDFTVSNGGTTIARIASEYPSSNDVGLSFHTFDGSLTEAMRIDKSGLVGIGITPSYPLHVQGSGNETVTFKNTTASVTSSSKILGLWYSADDDCTNGIFINMADQYAAIGSISCASTSSVSFNETSDYRIKSNVADLTDAAASVSALRPVTFTFTRDEAQRVHQGFLAHEVAEVYPLAITGEKDGMRTVPAVEAVAAVEAVEYAAATYDDDGNELTPEVHAVEGVEAVEAVPEHEVEEHQMIDKSKLVPLLTAAVQELTARIVALEAA